MNRLAKGICGVLIGVIASVLCFSTDVQAVEIEHPQLTVKSYEIINGKFEKCAECTLRVYIENVAEEIDEDKKDVNETAAEWGMITLYSEKIAPVTGKSNQIIFGRIEAGKSVAVDFDVNLDLIEKGPNVIEFVLVWADENNTTFSTSLHISPVLLETVGFEITSVNIPNKVYGDKNTNMSVYYENTGDESLRNVYRVVEGDIVQEKQVIELENLAAKGKKMVDYSLDLLNMGSNKVEVSFRYEDRNGNQYISETTEVIVDVTDKTYIEPIVEESNFQSVVATYRVYVIFGVVAVLLFVPFVISGIKRRGNKK